MEPHTTLRSFFMPFQSGQALLPNSSMVEVLPFATPLKMENAPTWVVGTILWRALNVPLVSVEDLIFGTNQGSDNCSRIVMVKTLGRDPRFLYFGLLGTDAPRVVHLERKDIVLNESAEASKLGVLSWVLVNDQTAIIPDIEAIETVLGPLMRHHS